MRLSGTLLGAALFSAGLIGGTIIPRPVNQPVMEKPILAADLHVHAFPGDGTLTPAQLGREARRRGIDVIAFTGHNTLVAARLAPATANDVLLLRGQEITAPDFHLIAVGIQEEVDWRLPLPDMIAEVHRQGGAAIAAHPTSRSWRPADSTAVRMLDGIEVAHPIRSRPDDAAEVDRFFTAVQAVNPAVSPIGSSDFHMVAPIGAYRTHLLTGERSARAVIDAIRSGRTVAEDARGQLFGRPADVQVVRAYLARQPERARSTSAEALAAASALTGLALLATSRLRR